jgi:protein SCO1
MTRKKMRAYLFPILMTASLLGAGCRRDDVTTAATTTITAASPAIEPSASIYPLDLALRDQAGDTINLGVFRGHPVIVTMFYGSCPSACPLLVMHVKRIEASLAPAARADLRVLLVSFDAERDTPAALRDLAAAHKVDVSRWRFAAASDDAARQLANVLDVNYAKGDEGFFSHNSVVSVLDADGRIVARSDDTGASVTSISDALTAIVSPR